MKINCVVVTYNRLELLKECLQAIEKQTYEIHKIVIINNSSTDGTFEFLNSLSGSDKYLIVHTEENVGGAGGFNLGLKHSVLAGCDYTWLMDDDTIPEPTALQELVNSASISNVGTIGFVCSQVNWIDGTQHVMNRVSVCQDKNGNPIRVEENGNSACKCKLCSFVSVMVNTEAVMELGLPIKEFFIWCDDLEYTIRIYKAGYTCLFADKSIVLHKTKTNYAPSIDKAPAEMAGRFYYQARNVCYIKRNYSKKNFFFYLWLLNKYRVYKHRIGKRTDDPESKATFLKAVKAGLKDGSRFLPKVEYIKKKQ